MTVYAPAPFREGRIVGYHGTSPAAGDMILEAGFAADSWFYFDAELAGVHFAGKCVIEADLENLPIRLRLDHGEEASCIEVVCLTPIPADRVRRIR